MIETARHLRGPPQRQPRAHGYAELHALSNFSFRRGASHPEELVARAVELDYAALAITDECSLAGIVRAHRAAALHAIKLIVGAEFTCSDGLRLVLLAPHEAAYAQLCALITRARRAAPKGGYRLSRDDAANLAADCIVLWVPQYPADAEQAHWIRRHFAAAWIAVELHRDGRDEQRLTQLRGLADAAGLPLVAAGDVRYHHPQRRRLADVLTALRLERSLADCGRALLSNAERHLRPLDTLRQRYPADLLAESLTIAARCRFSLSELRYQYPRELVPQGMAPIEHLRQLTAAGAARRWPQGVPAAVAQQLDAELRLIEALGYEAFFLTVEDIVRFARSRNILCQGRGSAANSAVCYALGITEVDPLRGNLLFERFLSRERDEPPDIDVDFEHQRREEVIQYVFSKYGRQRAALAATVIGYRPRSALRDVGRALGVSPEVIDRLAKSLAWWDKPEQLARRLQALGFDPADRDLRLWLELTAELIGFPRHLSQHVGGFVISERPLSTLVPVENAAMPGRTVIQWDKDDLESLGLLKVDLLALGMLSAIRRALELVNDFHRPTPALTLSRIPAEDAQTFRMIGEGRTLGVFQIESRAQINMLAKLKPRNFYDLVIQVAIVRPGPIQGGMVHPYLRRRAGQEAVDYPPRLEHVLARTLGVPIFQEQVMQIAVVAAGFSPGEADQMRRSMAAWKRSGGLEKFRERLLAGMTANGYDRDFAERIYRQILGFGSYGFPESHAASFALLAYASAWLKCHHPAAFVAGLLDSQPMGFYPPSMLVTEARRLGVEVRPVDVTVSDWNSSLEPGGSEPGQPALRLGLRLVGGLSEDSARALLAARAQRRFADLDDLAARAGLDARSRRALAEADALAALAGHRHAARWAVARRPLPGLLADAAPPAVEVDLPAPREDAEIVDDYRSLNLTLRRHPLALLRPRLQRLGARRAEELAGLADGLAVRAAGMVMFRQRPATASGLMFMTLEDETGVVNVIVPAKALAAQRDVLLGARLLLARGRLQNAGGSVHVALRAARDLSAWIDALPRLSRDFR